MMALMWQQFFFDISKAFGTVPHARLLQKLHATYIGLDPCILNWIVNYLFDRKQQAVNGVASASVPVTSDV